MTSTATHTEEPYERTTGPVHLWFELTYSSYQVVPRVLAHSMPIEWQKRFVTCLEELREAFRHVDQAEGYNVTPGSWVYVDELTDDQMRSARIGRVLDLKLAEEMPDDPGDDPEKFDAYEARYAELEAEWGGVYYDERGDELRSPDRVFVPGLEPLPPYRRGYVEPRLPEGPTRP